MTKGDSKIRKCPKCGSTEGQMNAGYSKTGAQRCLCGKCKSKYTLDPKYNDELREEAVRLYKSGMNGREVGRILNISKTSVYNWTKKLNNDSNKIEKGGRHGANQSE